MPISEPGEHARIHNQALGRAVQRLVEQHGPLSATTWSVADAKTQGDRVMCAVKGAATGPGLRATFDLQIGLDPAGAVVYTRVVSLDVSAA